MSTKALVLSSGGLDSTTCLALAIDKHGRENVSSISIFYGQKHNKELAAAKDIAKYYDINHYEFDLSPIMKYSDCSLLSNSTKEIIHKSYFEQISESESGIVSTYVPFRNGLFLSTAAALATSIYPDDDCLIYLGAHADDAALNAYADCSDEFMESMGKAISIGTYDKVKLVCPFVDTNKAGVVKLGLKLKVPYELTWSCYEGGEKPCMTCATCLDRIAAFKANNAKDPAVK
ncbi:7-cyano-7-deazaguanine synthase [Lachnospiraceae bacterium RM5]|nr:7-cyano-7-deazaguanine synthase [Lachnospiraceae bacterium RM5]